MNFFQEAVETAADHRTGLSASHLRDSARPCAAAVRRSGLVAVTNCDLAVTSPTPPVSPGRRQNNCHQQVPVSSVLLFGSNQGQEDTSAWQCTHTNRERGGGGGHVCRGSAPGPRHAEARFGTFASQSQGRVFVVLPRFETFCGGPRVGAKRRFGQPGEVGPGATPWLALKA